MSSEKSVRGATNAGTIVELPSAWALLKPSWKLTLLNWQTFVYLIFLPLTMLSAAVTFAHSKSNHQFFFVLGWIVLVATLGLLLVTMPALSYARLQTVRKRKVSYSEALTKGISTFLPWWSIEIMLVVLVGGGSLLVLIPGVYMLKRYVLARYIVVDKNVKALEAMQESAQLSTTYGSAMWSTAVLLFAVPIAFILIPGFLGPVILIGMFLWNMSGTALRYEQIVRKEVKKIAPKEKKHSSKNQRTKKKS